MKLEINLFFFVLGSVNHVFFRGDALASPRSLFRRVFKGKTEAPTKAPPLPDLAPDRVFINRADEGTHYAETHKDIDNLLKQNIAYVKSMKAQDPLFFDKLGAVHKPKFLWIGCADARVPANEIMGEDAGSVFVLRNVANMVVNTDFNLMAALQYAMDVLKIPDIIVCGHYDCGGVRASTKANDHVAPLENWLRNIRDVYRLHREELDSIDDPEKRHQRLVELNVIEQCVNLYKTGSVQRRFADETSPSLSIHPCVFDPKDGILRPLQVDFNKYLDEYHGIYDLYSVYGNKAVFIPKKQNIENVLLKNKVYVNSKREQDPWFFEKLGSVHKPKYLWIGCADARVPANEVMGEDAGSVFVLRNVANMVVNTDFNLMSALQYAMDVLKIPHIIVCGHYDCGGVRASTKNNDHVAPLENWLRNIRDVYRLHQEELDSISDPEKRHRRLVELNVIEQCINLYKTGSVQRRFMDKSLPYASPRIHACVFDPKDGILRPLQVDFYKYLDKYHGIYDLYSIYTKETVEVKEEKHYAETHEDIDNLLMQNKEYVNSMKAQDPKFFDKLGAVHKPKYLWIGCADARVPANEIMGEDAGSVFVLRNVANMVVNTDFNLMAALQYAMDVLKIPDIIVCGHYDCGGVRASTKTNDHVAPLENWLRNIRDVYRYHREELDSISDPEKRHRRLVELNVIEQCINLYKTGSVQRRFMDETSPSLSIHACVFDPKDGILQPLQVDFNKYLVKYHGIYDLYSVFEKKNAFVPETQKSIGNILEQNKEFVKSMKEQDPQFFDKLGAVHKPKFLWIGCADARVPANEIMGEEAGSVFVLRNVANMVVNTDFNLMAALQYAMNVLKIPDIFVCGHYDCGGVRASTKNNDHIAPLENWLRNIRDVYRLHQEELDSIRDPEKRHRRLVELNVIEQCINLYKTGSVQRRFKDESSPSLSIHPVVFDPKDGILQPLEVDFNKYLEKYHSVYDLYSVYQNNPIPKTQKSIESVLKKNKEYVNSKKEKDPKFFDKLGAVHKPKFLWIGCADARVPANEIMGEEAGSVFVLRNVANMVVNTDFNLMAALQYAMDVLKIPDIIVCGHYDCGGVRASTKTNDHVAPLENWLRNIRDVYRLHQDELDSIKDPEKRHRRLVELNVIEQCINLYKTGSVQRRYVDKSDPDSIPRIHACVFDPKDGILQPLQVDFYKYLEEYHGIYDLYSVFQNKLLPETQNSIVNILKQNEMYVDTKKKQDPLFFDKLGAVHKPKYLWIGCADARVPANEVMGEDAGSVFVLRNVANMVVNTDFNLMAALQYAMDVLKIPHIIVCGHYDCGGVRASMTNNDHVAPLENWLRNIRDVYRLHQEELDSIKDPEQRHRRLVELNVIEQCINLYKTGAVQSRFVDKSQPLSFPKIHACVFDPKDGILRPMQVDFDRYLEKYHGIYDLYSVYEKELVLA